MNTTTTFIPAPAGHRLAWYHGHNGGEIAPLLGWSMQNLSTSYGMGLPVVQAGAYTRLLTPDDITTSRVLTADQMEDFRFDTWNASQDLQFEDMVFRLMARMTDDLKATGRANIRHEYDIYDREAADRLVRDGTAVYPENDWTYITAVEES